MIPKWASWSVVIPCYNDSARLDNNAQLLRKFCRHYGAEIIVVDDGGSGLERSFLREICDEYGFRLLIHPINRGKWAAVRTGMLQSDRTHVILADCDLAVPPWVTIRAYDKHCKASDVMVGDRNKLQTGIPAYRRFLGWCFNKVVQVVLGGVFWRLKDTQCPGKCIPRSEMIISSLREEGFAGDVELILRYHQRGFRIVPVDVSYVNDVHSTVHPFRDGVRMLLAVFRIRRRWM